MSDRRAAVRLVLSCEHARSRVPRRWAGLFRGWERVLASHRGYDIGALALARHIGRRLGVPLHAAPATRLLIDPNRSLGHPRLFSERSRRLPIPEREAIRDQLYLPHRSAVEHAVAALVAGGARVLHLGVHSFTPRLGGETRRADVGLLYDPARTLEREIADGLARRLTESPLRVRRNYPYRGTADGFTTYLRTRFPASRYAGLELEVNHRLAVGPAGPRRRLQRLLASSLAEILAPPV